MLSTEQQDARSKIKQKDHKKHRLHLPHLHAHSLRKFVEKTPNGNAHVPNGLGGNPSSRRWTDEEIQQRQQIEEYIFSKLEAYTNKPRLWQVTHSSRMKRRLLDKSSHISELYSLPDDFVRDSINQLFLDVDNHVSHLRRVLQSTSHRSPDPNTLFQKVRKGNNEWRSLQLERAQHIFPDIDKTEYTDDELLKKYYIHIIQTLTPEPDKINTNCIAQLREQPFDLNSAYRKAEHDGREHIIPMLKSYHKRSTPDLEIIQEMVNLGFEHMKTFPKTEDFEDATSFLSKISLLHKAKQAYQSALHNMGDDFMLLRFGKIFGPNALPTTARANNQFIYLVHLLLKSISTLMMMMRTSTNDPDEKLSTIPSVISHLFPKETTPPIIKLNDENLFSAKLNVDQWTWFLEKWRESLRTLPIMLTEIGAFARLVRTTIGIGIARLFNFAETIIHNEQMLDLTFMNEQLFHAFQMGFYYGVAYAVVDCAQDEIRNVENIPAHHLAAINLDKNSNEGSLKAVEVIDKWFCVMEQLLSGEEFNRKDIPKTPLTPLLLETFDGLVTLTKSIDMTSLALNEIALLLRSQRMDKKITKEFCKDEKLYLGAMLKSHFTYTCATFLGNVKSAREESERLWIVPFLGQLTDDCRDFYDDITSKSVTPFTHYAAYIGRHQSSDKYLLNPFYAFLYLCTDLYLSSQRDYQTGAFLGRRIARTLRSIELSANESGLREFLHIFCQNNLPLHDYCWTELRSHFTNVSDPEKDFFRIVHKASIQYARINRKVETYAGDHLRQIEDALEIHSINNNNKKKIISSSTDRNEQLLISAMNYSVTAGGKRLRPLLMMMVSDLYKIDLKNVMPLACGIEYLHTSSLIFDDLPAQDNSDLRRGRPTLHKAVINNDIPEDLCEGRAQLAAVDLIAVSISLINHDLVKNGFQPDRVNQVISEISLSMHDLCIGQMMDLRAAHVGMEDDNVQLDELDRIAWFKTGKALEVVLITPAILALSTSITSQSIEILRIRELGRLMGILFQMRDDLLDVEGENIGKPAELDVKNNTVTYVSILGVENTRKRLKEFRRQTLKLVDECWPVGAGTIKDVVNYIVDRKN